MKLTNDEILKEYLEPTFDVMSTNVDDLDSNLKNLDNIKIAILETQVKELSLDLKAINKEHDRYVLKNGEEFFGSMPIETLQESLNFENLKPRIKYSLKDLEHKFKLKKRYFEIKDKFETVKSQLILVKINSLIKEINENSK